MNIQIFSKKKCFDSQKAERYFKERNVKFQKIDLNQKGMSAGELKSVAQSVGLRNLIDQNSKKYTLLNLDRISTPSIIEEILLNHPEVIKTPVVRNGKKATVGYSPEVWATWE